MELDFESKLDLINTLAEAGFHVNIIAVTLNRIEVLKEDIGVALLQAILLLNSMQNIESSASVEQKREDV